MSSAPPTRSTFGLKTLREMTLAAFISIFYWTYSRSWRVRHMGVPDIPKDTPKVYAHWHGDELLLIGAYAHSKMAVMASHSKDGALLKRVLNWLGYRVVRGSSSRGGAAGLKGLIDAVTHEGCNASLAVDGPRGPIYRVKPGILSLAAQTGCLLIPGSAAAERRFVFKKAWNQCYLPFPFSKCVILYGEPLTIPKDLGEGELERLRLQLEKKLLALKVEAERQFARTPDPRLFESLRIGV